MQQTDSSMVWHVHIDASGRVLLPAELRSSMGVRPGSELVWTRDEDGIHLRSFGESLAEIQAYYKSLAPAEVVWSDELIKQRRIEATNE